mgnify:CR=1 FL=1|jgi:chorismate synthase
MSIFGKNIRISLFGASHEKYIGLTIHGFPAGIEINDDLIKKRLKLRRGLNHLTSKRFETDEFSFISGVFKGFSTGAPLTVLVENIDLKSADYEKTYGLARPSHADYTQHIKYHGFEDYRGGGRASGRLTVVFIILGALCEEILVKRGIIIASRIESVYNIIDRKKSLELNHLLSLKEEVFPVISEETKIEMLDLIEKTASVGDSLGGIVETWIYGLPAGVGSPFFDSLESYLSHLIFSVPGVKGIEFGSGFEITKLTGSEANDMMHFEEGIKYYSNHSGGINGGISNGNQVYFRTAFKPTPSISKPQKTINFLKNESVEIEIIGRHDAIIAIKGLHVINALTNYAILDMIL